MNSWQLSSVDELTTVSDEPTVWPPKLPIEAEWNSVLKQRLRQDIYLCDAGANLRLQRSGVD